MITDTQRNARDKGIGSSDIAAIFGCNPWLKERDLWAIKTGRVEPRNMVSEAARIGQAMEPVILQLASEELGRKVVAPTTTFVRGILRANVDGMIDEFRRGQPIVEAKMTSNDEGWGYPGSDQVPLRVRLQAHHQMLCAGSTECWVARLLTKFSAKFDLYHLLYEPEVGETIEMQANEWWLRHVVADNPPEGIMSPDVAKAIRRTMGKSIEIPRDVAAAERMAKECLNDAEDAYEKAKYAIIDMMGDAEIAVSGGVTYSFKQVTTKRLDSKGLEAAHPDIAAGFRVETTARRWSVRAGQ